jgi:hypothetical protein
MWQPFESRHAAAGLWVENWLKVSDENQDYGRARGRGGLGFK